jgi:hypothetical protein
MIERLVYTARKPMPSGFVKNSNRLPSAKAMPHMGRRTHITGTADVHGTSRFLRTFGSIQPVRVTLCGRVVGVRWYEDKEPTLLRPDRQYHPPFCKNCLRALS